MRRWLIACVLTAGASAQEVRIGGVVYEKLGTREETERRMIDLLNPTYAQWGAFHQLGPFPYKGHGTKDLPTVHEPEEELSRMRHGGPGPDLARTYAGKNGHTAKWIPLGDITNRAVNMKVYPGAPLNNYTSGFVYGTITVEKATVLDVTMGSDDGLRFWLNGRLLVDQDVPRGLDPEEVPLRLDLQAGVNHILAKVTQGEGGWDYQINTAPPLSVHTDALLQYYLDLDFPRSPEDEYYRILTYPLPADLVLEVGGLDVLPDGRPIVCTRRGDVYIVGEAYADPPVGAVFTLFASGLHEPLGLSVRRDADGVGVYCVQRGELTRLVDTDGDDRADVYETFNDAWGVSGNYHEFAFGPKFDREGHAWVTLNVGFCGALGKAVAPYRGWAVKVTPEGEMIPVCDGLRSPNGIGMWKDGTMFYVDNQGDYVGVCRMTPLLPGSWAGHPASLRWRRDWSEGQPPPPMLPATIWFPYPEMGHSTADILLEGSGGKFGPFEGQFILGDQMRAMLLRVDLEVVDGVYQGAAFPFRHGFDCGVNRVAQAPDGSLLVGMTDRGWGSIGKRRFGLQRLTWTGKVPFEILRMHARPDGFELVFTSDVDAATAGDPASYSMTSYTYAYHETYGSPEVETEALRISGAEVLGPRRVRLRVEGLRSGGMGYVHELRVGGLRDVQGRALLHDAAYYTLQKIPRE